MGDPSNEITVSIAETAARTLERPIDELPPLSDSINLDAVETLLGDDSSEDVTITFPYAGHRVLVHSGETVYIRPIRDEQEGSKQRISFRS